MLDCLNSKIKSNIFVINILHICPAGLSLALLLTNTLGPARDF